MLPHQVIMAGKVAINPKLCSFFHNVETLWWVVAQLRTFFSSAFYTGLAMNGFSPVRYEQK